MRAGLPVLLLAALAACAPSEPPRHLVLVTIDTLRPDRLGAYGRAEARTPSFDALAARSLRFDNAFAHSSMTVPSMATLLTGLLPAGHGMFDNWGSLGDEHATLATRLAEAGFVTAGFVGNYALRPERGMGRGFSLYTEEYGAREAVRRHPENLAEPLTTGAIEWLGERSDSERIFLWVHYQEPHGPYTPPEFDPPAAEGARELRRSRTNSGFRAIPSYQWLGHGRLAEYSARYDGEIREVDRQLGRLVAALEKRGILDEAVLVVTADHGEAFGEEDLYCAHGEGLGEALLRVPLLLRAAGVAPGVRADAVRLIDVTPTALELLGLDASGLPGRSLLEEVGDRPLVAQVQREGKRWRSVRADGYELRERVGGESELLALPGADAAAGQGLRERLAATLEREAPWPRRGPARQVSAEERRALEALGYVD